MSTQHRPGREPDKHATPLLEKFYAAVKNGNIKRAGDLLGEIGKHPPKGLWMHRALALAIEGNPLWRHAMVKMLLASEHPPVPTGNSDFLKLVVFATDTDLAYTLFEHGFRAKPTTIGRILQQIGWNGKIDTTRMKPAYLEGASVAHLVDACAMAVVNNAPESWLRTLNAALPQPLPGQLITQQLMWKMARMKDGMDTIERRSLNLARDLWWVDTNMAQLDFDQVQHGRNYKGRPLWKDDHVAAYAHSLSLIQGSGLEEDLVTDAPAAPVKPRSRL